MTEVEERLDSVEGRLGSVEHGLQELRGEVGKLRDEVGGLRGEVGGLREKTDTLADDVQKLRVLGEENQRQLQLVIELHGQKFDEIADALKPLAEIHRFVRSVADDDELRIRALESRAENRPA